MLLMLLEQQPKPLLCRVQHLQHADLSSYQPCQFTHSTQMWQHGAHALQLILTCQSAARLPGQLVSLSQSPGAPRMQA